MMDGDKYNFPQNGKPVENFSLGNACECVIKEKHKISCSIPRECVRVLVGFARPY